MHVPGGRRIHKRITPSLGGIAIFIGFVTSTVLWTNDQQRDEVSLLLSLLILPFLLGLMDDLVHLSPLLKLFFQWIAGSLLFFKLDIRLTSTYDLFDIGSLSDPVSYLLTILIVLLVTNSFNLIDGIDGLAGAFSLLALIFFGVWFKMSHSESYALVCFVMAGSVLGFLMMNWEPSKIFMGDTGSLLLGMMLAILCIAFLNENAALADDAPTKFQSGAVTVCCLMIIPLTDTIRIVILRLSRGTSPFAPDKRHIHHAIVRVGNSHRKAVIILSSIHLAFVLLAILLQHYKTFVTLPVVISCATALCLLLDRRIGKYAGSGTSSKE